MEHYENLQIIWSELNEFSIPKSPVQISIMVGKEKAIKSLKRISEDYNFSIIECGELDTESISKKQISDIGIGNDAI